MGVHHHSWCQTNFLASFVNTYLNNHSNPNEKIFSCIFYAESFAKPCFPCMARIRDEANHEFLSISDNVHELAWMRDAAHLSSF